MCNALLQARKLPHDCGSLEAIGRFGRASVPSLGEPGAATKTPRTVFQASRKMFGARCWPPLHRDKIIRSRLCPTG